MSLCVSLLTMLWVAHTSVGSPAGLTAQQYRRLSTLYSHLDEVPSAAVEAALLRLVQEMDKNGDMEVDMEELHAWMLEAFRDPDAAAQRAPPPTEGQSDATKDLGYSSDPFDHDFDAFLPLIFRMSLDALPQFADLPTVEVAPEPLFNLPLGAIRLWASAGHSRAAQRIVAHIIAHADDDGNGRLSVAELHRHRRLLRATRARARRGLAGLPDEL
ncbi:uncharacterized protein LOC108683366 [Hyalella azteca]|uniref:Uncharacterized protein LOC108683366 n=1 Tax=Hyalella azteca TaxID=294128 RepID=A0A8B7PPN1_HYAAZ|nr:uncharacterized protein LOC108683366 [Hyalella azteca]